MPVFDVCWVLHFFYINLHFLTDFILQQCFIILIFTRFNTLFQYDVLITALPSLLLSCQLPFPRSLLRVHSDYRLQLSA